MNVSRFQKRHKNDNKTQTNTKKPNRFLAKFDSIHGLFAVAAIGLILSGAAIAGESSWFNKDTDKDGTHAATSVNTDENAFFANSNRSQSQSTTDNDDATTARNRSSSDNNAAEDQTSNQTTVLGDIDIDTDNPDNSSTVIHEDGTVEHKYQSDDGQTTVNIKVKSGGDSDTDIDIDTDSYSSSYDSDSDNRDVRRNPRYNR